MTTTQYRHHPATCAIRMMTEDELQGLAESIKRHGLFQPIVLDSEGAVVDGRCRLAACEIAGVEPRFRKLEEGTDVEEYIISVNIARTHNTPGQKAMWCAQIERVCPDQKPVTTVPALRELIDWAHLVIEHAPELGDAVMKSGMGGFPEAFKEACKRRDDMAARKRKLDALREKSPHLASLVGGDELSLDEALALSEEARPPSDQRGSSTMSADDAEEYTRTLGQIVAGSWRQIALAKRLGVPKALGLSTEQWVNDRLGGYIKMSVAERREAVRNLTDEGHSAREAAEILGVSHDTAARDVRNLTPDPLSAVAASGEVPR